MAKSKFYLWGFAEGKNASYQTDWQPGEMQEKFEADELGEVASQILEHYQEIAGTVYYHTPGTIASASHQRGMDNAEPLIVAMDSMLRYAKAFERAYGSKVGADGVLGKEYARVISGLRGLLNGNGAVAMERERGITTDSKDNGVIEALYWECCRVSGLDGDNI